MPYLLKNSFCSELFSLRISNRQNNRKSTHLFLFFDLKADINGENNSNSKLTELVIKKIKSELTPGSRDFGYRALAKKYKVSQII